MARKQRSLPPEAALRFTGKEWRFHLLIVFGRKNKLKVTDPAGVRARCRPVRGGVAFIEQRIVTYFT